MESAKKQRTAVILVHGMGNQMPLTSIREFVENVNKGGERLYSSPNRVMDDLETRRFSYHNRSIDYYEFYWAHLMDEPSMFDVLKWTFLLLFTKTPSKRARIPIWIARILIILLSSLAIYLFIHFNGLIHTTSVKLSLLASGVIMFILYQMILPILRIIFSNAILQSIGDVVRYTVPSPQNIEVRNKIRQKGIDMLTKLHEAKNSSGEAMYDNIILVGHSLGSIVAYDLLTFLFPRHHSTYVFKGDKDQEVVKNFAKYADPSLSINPQEYKEDQRKVALNYRKFDHAWKVSDFITIGSPLTHASMVMAKDENELRLRQKIRELPTCPPSPDATDAHRFFYPHGEHHVLIPHHAAHFTMTRWTNIYFANDFIGGALDEVFGQGIHDHKIKAKSSWWKRHFPFASHTAYWDKKEWGAVNIMKDNVC